jgi:hypothetical protein
MKNLIKEINIENIELMNTNPRYTIEFNKKTIRNEIDNTEYNELKIVEKLLKNEDNFENFYMLLNSLNKGFKGYIDQYPIVTKKKNNKYFVIEGNRRILCLKLIFNLITYKEFEEIIEKIKPEIIENFKFDDEAKNTNIKESEFNKNINEIYKILKNELLKSKSKKIFVTEYNFDLDNEEKFNYQIQELIQIIYARHGSSENKTRLN